MDHAWIWPCTQMLATMPLGVYRKGFKETWGFKPRCAIQSLWSSSLCRLIPLVAADAGTCMRNMSGGVAEYMYRCARYGYQPQRIALWIYWQAAVLLCKGARFFPYPDQGFQARAEGAARNPRCCGGAGGRFVWQPPRDAPWSWDAACGGVSNGHDS